MYRPLAGTHANEDTIPGTGHQTGLESGGLPGRSPTNGGAGRARALLYTGRGVGNADQQAGLRRAHSGVPDGRGWRCVSGHQTERGQRRHRRSGSGHGRGARRRSPSPPRKACSHPRPPRHPRPSRRPSPNGPPRPRGAPSRPRRPRPGARRPFAAPGVGTARAARRGAAGPGPRADLDVCRHDVGIASGRTGLDARTAGARTRAGAAA